MRYVWTVESPNLIPSGPAYRARRAAREAARETDGCGNRAGMRAVRRRVPAEVWARAV